MDYLVILKLSAKKLKRLNRCQVHLQVLFLSNISSVDGSIVLPGCKQGRRDTYRKSSVDWPHQPSPPKQDWSFWTHALCHLETADRLSVPLGDWVATSHETWPSFFDSSTLMVYVQNSGSWTKFYPIYQSTHHNSRSSVKPWYSWNTSKPSDLPDQPLYPTRILFEPLYHDSLFQISVSASSIPQAKSSEEPYHIPGGEELEAAPHLYYIELLQWDTTSLILQLEELSEAITRHDLHICADGAFRKTVGQGSHAWVF